MASCTWRAALVELIGPEPIVTVRMKVGLYVFWTEFSVISVLFHTCTSYIRSVPNFLPKNLGMHLNTLELSWARPRFGVVEMETVFPLAHACTAVRHASDWAQMKELI